MDLEQVQLASRTMVGISEAIPMSKLSQFFERAFQAAATEITRQGAHPAGPPIALYRGQPTDTVDVIAGFPVEQPVEPANGVTTVTLPDGLAVQAIHFGPYDSLSMTYGALTEWLSAHGATAPAAMWEEYLVGPDRESDPSKWQTRIVCPL